MRITTPIPSSRRRRGLAAHGRQRGVALLVALVFLVLLTILALASSGGSLLQQKMVGATRNAQLAEWGAESALRGAEWRLWTASSSPTTRLKCGESSTLSNCYVFDRFNPNTTVTNFRTQKGWVTTGATQYTNLNYSAVQSSDASPKLAADPYYIIEDLGIERPPGVGSQHESGATGTSGAGYTSVERHLYRITARSPGGTMNTIRVAESVFAAKSD